MDSCRPETAATSRAAGDSVAPPGISVILSYKPVSRSIRLVSSPLGPALLAPAGQASWVETPSRSTTEGTMKEEKERLGLMDTLSFLSNTPGQ